ncbi:MAG TPA: hypothetical protein ENG28_04430 [Deltaproteobacteria bacterium]|nr:hypothetical protein [Deltaproteobacteria bacterium]
MEDRIEEWISEVKAFNKSLGLLSRRAEDDIEELVRETISLLKGIQESEIADLGAGSGLMGIIFSLLYPASRVYLIERAYKKAMFLEHVADKLSLHNVIVVGDEPLKGRTRRFDALMSRAFSPMAELEQAVLKYLDHKGRFYYASTARPRLDNTILSPTGSKQADCNPRIHLYTYVMNSPKGGQPQTSPSK